MTQDLPRFFIEPKKIFNKKFIIEDERDIKKIRSVLRLKPGDHIQLLDNAGHIFTAEIEKLQKNGVKGIIVEKSDLVDTNSDTDKRWIILAQALPKLKRFDDIIRMNTEIGINEFIPFESAHSVIKIDNFNEKKLERWRKLAKEAARQSERLSIPEIREPITFNALLELELEDFEKILLFARKHPESKDIYEFRKIQKSILIAIGPEGGFSDQEVKMALENGFKIAHINLPILRTETAGLAANAILLSCLGYSPS